MTTLSTELEESADIIIRSRGADLLPVFVKHRYDRARGLRMQPELFIRQMLARSKTKALIVLFRPEKGMGVGVTSEEVFAERVRELEEGEAEPVEDDAATDIVSAAHAVTESRLKLAIELLRDARPSTKGTMTAATWGAYRDFLFRGGDR